MVSRFEAQGAFQSGYCVVMRGYLKSLPCFRLLGPVARLTRTGHLVR
jgi:hypothetical protein